MPTLDINRHPEYLYPFPEVLPWRATDFELEDYDLDSCVGQWIATHRAFWFLFEDTFAIVFAIYRYVQVAQPTDTIELGQAISITQVLSPETQGSYLPLVIDPNSLQPFDSTPHIIRPLSRRRWLY